MKKIILTSIIVLSSVFGAFSAENTTNEVHVNTNSVSGQVIDKKTNEALAGVAVVANGQKVYTDFDGKFTVNNLCGDKCTIVISQISYEPQTVELNIQNKESVNILLSKR